MGRTNKLYSFIKYGNFSDDNINYLKQDTGKNNGQLIRDSFDRLISSAKSFNNTDYEIGLMKNNIELIKILCSKQKFDADEIEINKARIKRARAALITCRNEAKAFKDEILDLINIIDEIILDKSIDPNALRELIKQLIDKKEDVNIIKKFININKEAVTDSVELFDIVFKKAINAIRDNSRDIYYYITLLKVVWTSKINQKKYQAILTVEGRNKWTNELHYIINGLRRPFDTDEVLKKYELITNHSEYKILNIKKAHSNSTIITLDKNGTHLRDDALSITKDGNLFIVKIYITDVGRFIKPNSKIDLEARNNYKNFCLPEHRVEIFNSRITEALSLNENVPRGVLALTLVFTDDGRIVDYSFEKENIIVSKNISYSQGDRILKGAIYKELYNDLNDLKSLAYALKARNSIKGDYWKKKDAVKDSTEHDYESDMIVREFIITYNRTLALIAKEHNYPYVYRMQDKEYITPLMKELNIEINGWTKKIINELFLNSKYSSKPLYHHGLGFNEYSHSTGTARQYVSTYNQYLVHQFYFNDIPEFFDSETFEDLIEYFNQRETELSLMYGEYMRALQLKR